MLIFSLSCIVFIVFFVGSYFSDLVGRAPASQSLGSLVVCGLERAGPFVEKKRI